MTRALTAAEIEDRTECRCAVSTVRVVAGHVFRQLADGSEIEVRPADEWDGTPFDELTLPAASGNAYEGVAEGLYNAGLRTVADLLTAWHNCDWRLESGATRLPGEPGSRPMYATCQRILEFMRHLERRRLAWERWRETG